jgi:beta-galactosidase
MSTGVTWNYRWMKFMGGVLAVVQSFVSQKLFPVGSTSWQFLTWLYINSFNIFLRQPTTDEIKQRMLSAGQQQREQQSYSPGSRSSGLPQQQDPEIVGHHRRPMHHKSRSFSTRFEALQYWRQKQSQQQDCQPETRCPTTIGREQLLLLTGHPGIPDKDLHWKFQLIGDPFDIPSQLVGWQLPGFDASTWSTIALPQHWQLQGFDVPLYTNTAYPFRFDPPFTLRDGEYHLPLCDEGLGASKVPHRHHQEPGVNATGLYRHSFSLPTSWWSSHSTDVAHHRVFLVFEGVDSCLTVWLNGQFIGYSQDSCLSVEFDVTTQLQDISNTLAVEVSRWCDGSYLEDQDKWWLSGIYREVFLVRKSTSFIADVECTSDILFDEFDVAVSSDIHVSVLTEGIAQTTLDSVDVESKHAVRVELWERNLSIGDGPAAVATGEVCPESRMSARRLADGLLDCDVADRAMNECQHSGLTELTLMIPNPALWSAEDPNLYVLLVTLYPTLKDAIVGDGEGLHTETFKIGIREVSFGSASNSTGVHCLLVNRKKITIAGVNRLEFEPQTGRSVSKESMIADAKLIKRLNFNAVRTAHYPQHPFWLDVCDEIGLYCVDEANIESHGFQALGQPVGYLSHDIRWRGAMASRVSRMYERDKNHACVIGWSLGNESGHGPTHDLLSDWLRARDPRRYVHVCFYLLSLLTSQFISDCTILTV